MIHYSFVIPVKDEAPSLPHLYKELKEVSKKLGKPYEIIFIDDGSSDNSHETLLGLKAKYKNTKIVKLRANFGKSYALSIGFNMAVGKIIITLDSDLQDDPNEIPRLLNAMNKNNYDLVTGWRKKRQDSFTKKTSSYLFNAGTSFIAGVKMHDLNCGMKVMKKEVAEEINLRGELHRFIPVLAHKRKFKVGEEIINHRPRRFGTSKYGKLGITRSWKGIIDLLTTIFVSDFSTKPAHFFGSIGLFFLTVGFFMDAYVSYIKITTGTTQGKIPLLIAGVLFILIGIQLISTGLIAEMLSQYFSKKNSIKNYNVDN